MAEWSDTECILQVARTIVADIAPEELKSFPLMAEVYKQDPQRLLTSQTPGEAELGMGPGELLLTWTPTILLLVQQAVVQGSKDAVEESTKTLMTRLFGRIVRRNGRKEKEKQQITSLPAPGRDLTPEELRTLHAFFIEAAQEHGVKPDKARLIADCAVGKWAMKPQNVGEQS